MVTLGFQPGLRIGMRGSETGQENVCHSLGRREEGSKREDHFQDQD